MNDKELRRGEVLGRVKRGELKLSEAARMLAGWDGDLAADSGAALLYEMVIAELSERFHAAVIPHSARDIITRVNFDAMLTALETFDMRLGPDPAATRRALIDGALAGGWAKALEVGGADPGQWRWGDRHRVTIAHPLDAVPAIADAFPAIMGGESGGDGVSVVS